MKNFILASALTNLLILCSFGARAATHYVDLQSSNPLPPYTSWDAAATNIQDAVDVAADGDTIRVTNGVYSTGGRVKYGALTNRVVIDKSLTVESMNGPQATAIEGCQLPGLTNGDNAIRCVYLTNGAALIGFTLTNGGTGTNFDLGTINYGGGGTWCESTNVWISDCIFAGNAAGLGGGDFSGTLSNCTFIGNSADDGGGASHADLRKCAIIGNRAGAGGGAFCSTLADCLVASNSATSGGGAFSVSLYLSAPEPRLTNCTIIYNSAQFGGGASAEYLSHCLVASNWARDASGGADGCDVDHSMIAGNTVAFGSGGGGSGGTFDYCVLSNNTASTMGGGVSGARLNHCIVIGNSAQTGGGVEQCTVYNSDVVSNSAAALVGGADGSDLYNCILYYNTPEDQGHGCSYCCVSQVPAGFGGSNFTNAPLFVNLPVGDLHLQPDSPCINSGLNLYVTNSLAPFKVNGDLDGNSRIVGGTVDIGPYEYQMPTSVISYAWLQEHHLPADGSVDNKDSDHDGQTTIQEWAADTDPADPASVFQMLMPTNSLNGVVVTWTSSPLRFYTVERSTDLTSQSSFAPLTSVNGTTTGVTSITDSTSDNDAAYYRVSVQRPPF